MRKWRNRHYKHEADTASVVPDEATPAVKSNPCGENTYLKMVASKTKHADNS